MHRSGLIARLERHLALTAGEREAINSAEQREIRLKPGEILMAEGGASDALFVVH